jgi:hypothetical protein
MPPHVYGGGDAFGADPAPPGAVGGAPTAFNFSAPSPHTAGVPYAIPVAAPVAPGGEATGFGGPVVYGGASMPGGGFGAPTYGAGPMAGYGGVSGGTPGGGLSAPPAVPLDQAPVIDPGPKDLWAAIAFWVHVLVILIIAFAAGAPAIARAAAQGDRGAASRSEGGGYNASLGVRMIVLAMFTSAAVSAIAFKLLQRCAGGMVRAALYGSLIVQAIFTVLAFVFSVGMGIFLLIMLALSALYVYWVRHRIPFAAAHLEVAAEIASTYRSLFLVAVGMMMVQGLWAVFWSMAAFGVTAAARSGVLLFLFLVSFYWGWQVFKNVMAFVTASVTGNWWWLGAPDTAVKGGLHRAFTTSFGSIAFGSLIVAILAALEQMAQMAREKAERRGNVAAACALCFAECVLGMVRRAVEYFNKWAFCYIALTGSKFTQAGREVMQLFRDRGWSAVINDDLVGTTMGLVCIAVGVVSAAVSGGTAYAFMAGGGMATNAGTVAGTVAFLSFLVGIAMASVMTSVLTTAVRTVYVCFAMAPNAAQATHPTAFAALVNAWHKAHPNELSACGYTAAYLSSGAV